MPILGPDGQPIGGRRKSVSPEVQAMLEQVRAIAAQGALPQALQQMAFVFQEDVSSLEVHNLAVELLESIAKEQQQPENDELQLFKLLRDNAEDPEIYYTLANRFFQLGQTLVARPFYAKAKELIGNERNELHQNVTLEFGQILMEIGGYQESVDMFQELNDAYGGLPVELILKMSEAYALLRKLDESETLYSVISEEATAQNPGLEEWREETGDLIARVEDFSDRETLGLREWHYVQTRGMLLATNPDQNFPGERFAFFAPQDGDIAYIVSLAAATLDSQGYAPNRLLWLGERSEVLARLFAEWWEIAEENIRPYQAGDNTEDEESLALLVMSHSANVFDVENEETLYELFEAKAGLITFALDVQWTERQPLTPDLAGFMAQVCYLPWEATVSADTEGNISIAPIEEEPDAKAIAQRIAKEFPAEAECDVSAQKFMECYAGCRDLILNHRDGSLFRKQLQPHSPVPSPRFTFG